MPTKRKLDDTSAASPGGGKRRRVYLHEFQRKLAWRVMHNRSTLLVAPTGSGKTIAAIAV